MTGRNRQRHTDIERQTDRQTKTQRKINKHADKWRQKQKYRQRHLDRIARQRRKNVHGSVETHDLGAVRRSDEASALIVVVMKIHDRAELRLRRVHVDVGAGSRRGSRCKLTATSISNTVIML